MAKFKGAKKALDSYTVKGTYKVVKGEIRVVVQFSWHHYPVCPLSWGHEFGGDGVYH